MSFVPEFAPDAKSQWRELDFVLVPRRHVERLRQLERREELRLAKRRGDDKFLDRELAKARQTAALPPRPVSQIHPSASGQTKIWTIAFAIPQNRIIRMRRGAKRTCTTISAFQAVL